MANSFKKIVSAAAVLAMLGSIAPAALAEVEGSPIGGTDFTGVTLSSDGKNRFLQSSTATTKDLDGYVQIANGARSDGANGNTGWYGKSGYIEADLGQYVTSGRGPSVNFTVPAEQLESKRIVLSFSYMPTNGTNNTADLYLVDAVTGNDLAGEAYDGTETPTLAVGKELTENAWNSVRVIIETDGTCFIFVDGKFVSTGSITPGTLPQLQFTQTASAKDQQSKGGIDNVYYYVDGETEASDFVAWEKTLLNIPDVAGTVEKKDDVYVVSADFDLPTTSVPGTEVEWNVYQKAKDSDTLEATEYAAVEDNKLTAKPGAGMENYDIVLRAVIKSGDTSDTKDFALQLKGAQDIIEEVLKTLTLSNKDGSAVSSTDDVYDVTKNLSLPTEGDSATTIAWSLLKADGSTDSRIDTSDGTIYPTDSTDTATLRAAVSFGGVTMTKDFTVKLPNVKEKYFDYIVAVMQAVSADGDTVTYPVANIGTVNTDIKLPTTFKTITLGGSAESSATTENIDGKVNVEWTVTSGNAKIVDGNTIEYTTQDFDAHEIQFTGKLTYVKNDKEVCSYTTEAYKYNVQFTAEDVASTDAALGKYKVRFDAALDSNFNIPSSVSGNITLPSTGKFGSSFAWTSDAPSVISNSGKYTRPTSDKNVTLSVAVTSGASSVAKNFTVSVAGRSNTGGGGGGSSSSGGGSSTNIGSSGSVNPSPTNTTTAEEKNDKLKEEAAAANDLFTDLSDASWARGEINALAKAGVINGKEDGSFVPNANVTRAEFAKMLMGVFGLNSSSYTSSSFRDISTSDWYFESVETAYNLGIITGVSDGVFSPNTNITRQDMAVMVMRAAQATGNVPTAVTEGVNFSDVSAIADYAKLSVDTLQKAGIINGMDDSTFAPLGNATRAQAAKILYSFLNK